MSGKLRRAEELKRKFQNELTLCEDNCAARDMLARLRRLSRALDEKPLAAWLELGEMSERARDLRLALRERNNHLADVNLTRLERLTEEMSVLPKKRGVFMGLFSKLTGRNKAGKPTANEARLRSSELEAEQKIFALEKKIAEMSAARETMMTQFKDIAGKCAALNKDSFEYQTLRQKALLLKPQINALETQITTHVKLLESNAKYSAMLKTGRTNFELRSYMPDTAEADVLMKLVADDIQEISDEVDIFASSVNEFGGAIERTGFLSDSLNADREFDDMVSKAKTHIEAGAEAPKPEEAVSPAENPAAGSETIRPEEELT